MSACYRLVLDSVCRSNHHRLAVMALDHLQGRQRRRLAQRLPQASRCLSRRREGARRGLQGFQATTCSTCAMAIGAALRRLRANGIAAPCARSRQQDWKHAAYCAGVMSHYVVDPVQPFHTHQTEEEEHDPSRRRMVAVQGLPGTASAPHGQRSRFPRRAHARGRRLARAHGPQVGRACLQQALRDPDRPL
jgi:hypothetical protein